MRNAFCQNEYCQNPGAKVVPVSVDRPSDQRRTFCIACENAYSAGVQHGTMLAQAMSTPFGGPKGLTHLSRFLKKDGFVILTFNEGDPSRLGPYEAWAYQGPLDLRAARPVTFGVGVGIPESLAALEHQLMVLRSQENPGARRRRCPSPT